MSNIYCTYLTVYNGNLMPKFYIGHSSIGKIQKGYHGSVSSKKYKAIWKEELKKHPELFKTFILTTHKTKKDAVQRESRFHESLSVHKNQMYINMATANVKFFNCKSNQKGKTYEEIYGIEKGLQMRKIRSKRKGHRVLNFRKPKKIICDHCKKLYDPGNLKRHLSRVAKVADFY